MKKSFALFLALIAFSAFGQTFKVQNLQVLGNATIATPLAITYGGTGASTQGAALTAILGSSTVPIANGGTGASTQPTALTAILGSSAVPIANGGTGATTQPAALTAILGSSTVPIANGGTGAATQPAALTAILGSSTIPIANGGTGASTQGAALTAILGSSTVPIANGGTNSATATGATSNLQYLRGSTGSAARSLTNKFQEECSVADFAGADATGASSSSAAFAAAYTACSDIVIPPGTWRLSSAQTWAKGIVWEFKAGAAISVDTGITVTINGQVVAPIKQIFSGLGSVVGIRQVYPEWWGARGDGTGDDQPALQAAHTDIQASQPSDGGRPTIFLTGQKYQVNNTWTIAPTANIGLAIRGNGTIFSGSRIVAASTFPAAPVLLVDGSTDSVQKIADFALSGFGVVPSAGGSGSATVGIQIGSTSSTKSLIGLQASIVEDVFVSNFPIDWEISHTRLVTFRRISGWNDTIVAPSIGLLITVNGGFTGDLRFEDSQWVGQGVAGFKDIFINASAGAFSGGNNSIAGIKFIADDFYAADKKVNLFASAGAYVSDIWFIGCQWDGNSNSDLFIESNNAGSRIDDIHVASSYMAGGNLSASNDQITIASTGSFGTINSIFVNDSTLQLAQGRTFNASANGGATVSGITLVGNQIRDNNNTAGAAVEFNGVTSFNANNNVISKLGPNFPKYFLQIDAGSDNFSVANNTGGLGVVSTAAVLDNSSAGAHKVIRGNIGYNPIASTSITVTSSPFTYTNNTGDTVSVFVTGGTVSNVTLGGNTVSTLTNIAVPVPQGASLVVTYTVAPTMTYLGY